MHGPVWRMLGLAILAAVKALSCVSWVSPEPEVRACARGGQCGVCLVLSVHGGVEALSLTLSLNLPEDGVCVRSGQCGACFALAVLCAVRALSPEPNPKPKPA